MRRLLSTIILVVLTFSLSTLLPVQRSYAFDDNVWWGECSGRYTVGSVDIKYSSGSKLGNLTVFGCSGNGYFFSRVNTSVKTSIYAEITRTSPYFRRLSAQNGSSYSVSTNMVKRLNGGCYTAIGWAGSAPAKTFRFCW
jgi:hypothetical protein